MGRPPKSSTPLKREKIVTIALDLLDRNGEKAVTFRALAAELNVTPMAIKYHIGTREELFSAMAGSAFEFTPTTQSGLTAREKLTSELTAYCLQVINHPNLTLYIFKNPAVIEQQLIELNENIVSCLASLNKTDSEVHILQGLIVDYLHGFAISASAYTVNMTGMKPQSINDFEKALNWLLDRVFSNDIL